MLWLFGSWPISRDMAAAPGTRGAIGTARRGVPADDAIWATIRAVDTLDILVSRLPDGAVTVDAEILRERAIDSWALALLRRARGDELPIPAAVIFPASTEDVATVLAWASETGMAVTPRGLALACVAGLRPMQGRSFSTCPV